MTPLALALSHARGPGAVTRARKRIGRVPPARDPNTVVLRYHRDLRAVLLDIERALADELAPLLGEWAAPEEPDAPRAIEHATHVRLDASSSPLWHRPQRRRPSISESLAEPLDRARRVIGGILRDGRIERAAERAALGADEHARVELRRQMLATVGVDPFYARPQLAAARDRFVEQNVRMISGIAETQLAEIGDAVRTAVVRGTRVEALAREIERRGEVSRSRAAFLARDQVLRANAEITEQRQRAVGITRYRWRTSNDERVRPRHEDLEGTLQEWSNPPVVSDDGRRGHPGSGDYQCRCTAEPDLEGVL